MSKVMLGLFMTSTFMLAGIKTMNASPQIVQSGIKIIDIRTKPEWIETGIVKDSITITFFDARGNYDAQKFLDEINTHIDKNEEFALICRTGSRTTSVSDFLGRQGYSVINLKGGVNSLARQGYELVKYTR
jgi:rhodanese-related sulfurtransferase